VTADAYRGALEAVDRILNREPEADEVVCQAVAAVHERLPSYRWVGIWFVEAGELALGPWAGEEPPARARVPADKGGLGPALAWRRTEVGAGGPAARFPWTASEIAVPVLYEGSPVAVLAADSDTAGAFGPADAAFLERLAVLVSAHALVAWDTGGVAWSELS
jgi:putative methionine-R-sulfoxide reductase with GAF domain